MVMPRIDEMTDRRKGIGSRQDGGEGAFVVGMSIMVQPGGGAEKVGGGCRRDGSALIWVVTSAGGGMWRVNVPGLVCVPVKGVGGVIIEPFPNLVWFHHPFLESMGVSQSVGRRGE